MRFFNTAGPVQPEIHYHVPPLARLDADDLLLLMRQRKYFVLHAPRQTGKTSALLALRDELNAGGDFRCVYVNVEVGQSAREDVGAAVRAILSALASEARYALDTWPAVLHDAGPHDALREATRRFRRASTRAGKPSMVRAPSRRRSPGRANTTSSTVSKPLLRRYA